MRAAAREKMGRSAFTTPAMRSVHFPRWAGNKQAKHANGDFTFAGGRQTEADVEKTAIRHI